MTRQKKFIYLFISCVFYVLCFLCGSWKGLASDSSPQDRERLSAFEVPGSTLLGLYDWDGDLLVYYMEDRVHKLCLMDSTDGSILSEISGGYDRTLTISFCNNTLSEEAQLWAQEQNCRGENDALPEVFFPDTQEDSRGIIIDDGIFCENDKDTRLLRVYSTYENKFQWMDKYFHILYEYVLEEEISGQPLMDEDNAFVYYVNSSGDIIQQHRSTGEKMILETGGSFYMPPYLEGLYNNGTVAVVSGNFLEKSQDGVSDNIRFKKVYIDTVNNSIINTTEIFASMTGTGEDYFAWVGGVLNQAVFGSFKTPDEKWEFIFDVYEEYDNLFPWPDDQLLLTCYTSYEIDNSSEEICSLYSFETGQRVDTLSLPLKENCSGIPRVDYACYMSESTTAVFHLNSHQGIIYVWHVDSQQNKGDASINYKEPYLPSDAHNQALMESLRTVALRLEDKYDVEICLGDECPLQLEGYRAETDVSAAKVRRALKYLGTALGRYPEGFFEQLYGDNGEKLKFYLVRCLVPDGEDSLSSTIGLYGGDAGQYIALATDSPRELKTLIYHEISHAIDYKISGCGNQNYVDGQWDELNPDGFSYAFSYRANAVDTSWEYIFNAAKDNDDAYFIDRYSKSFPTEDRARIMEKAMGLYPESSFFESQRIAKKLEWISNAIRSNFDTLGWPDILWWERPLTQEINES